MEQGAYMDEVSTGSLTKQLWCFDITMSKLCMNKKSHNILAKASILLIPFQHNIISTLMFAQVALVCLSLLHSSL